MPARIEERSSHGPTPLAARLEWAGFAPLQPPQTPEPVVAIARDEQHGDLMDFFWAAVARGELSQRVLDLTGEIILQLNSSNYSVWEWRWRCVGALGGPAAHAAEEKALMRVVAAENPKNYQLWNARRRLALALGPEVAEEELEFAASCLLLDAKNYHAWAHRQAVLAALGSPRLWQAELAYCERLLRDDLRNNSAWSQRRFVVAEAPLEATGPAADSYSREVDLVASKLRLAPHNEAAWGYLRGLAVLPGVPGGGLAADARVLAACREALAAQPSCVPALGLLTEVLLAQAALLEEAAQRVSGSAGSGDASGSRAARWEEAAARARCDAATALCKLAVADPLRRSYYELQLASAQASEA